MAKHQASALRPTVPRRAIPERSSYPPFEAAIQREYYRALHELERLQRRRQGEFVLPPVSVHLSVAGGEAPGGGEATD